MDFTTFHGSGEIPDGKKRIVSEEGEKKKKQRERGKKNEKELLPKERCCCKAVPSHSFKIRPMFEKKGARNLYLLC